MKALLHSAIFSTNCLATALRNKLLRKLHNVTGVVLQLLLFRLALHEVELDLLLATLLLSLSPVQQFPLQFLIHFF